MILSLLILTQDILIDFSNTKASFSCNFRTSFHDSVSSSTPDIYIFFFFQLLYKLLTGLLAAAIIIAHEISCADTYLLICMLFEMDFCLDEE